MSRRLVSDHAGQYPVTRLCALVNVARSTYYEWPNRAPVTPEAMISERPEKPKTGPPLALEGDPAIGPKRSAIGTLVERTTRFTMLIHLPRGDGYGVIPRTRNGPLAG